MTHCPSKYALCPFYHFYERHKICCEGVIENSSIHLAFASPEARREYEKKFCDVEYRKCPVAKMLYEKYGGIP